MRRKHPKKSNKWITKKYCKTHEGKNWVFYGEKQGREYYLAETASVPIKRHAKVKAQANPYNPAWETYYEKRLDVPIADTLKGKRWLLHLWKEQNGLCPMCQQKITKITGWHSHHIEWRSKGGPDRAENRVLLHPNRTRTVISNSIARVYTWRNRVPQRARDRLELPDAKVSRAVLRGRNGGNALLLPDTDVKDAEWIADLLQHGLLKASFIPSSEQQAVRDLTRTRMRLIQERTRLINRIQKVLEDANIKLASVVTDLMGVTGQAILMALLAGEVDPKRLAHLARGSLVKKQDQLQAALQGKLLNGSFANWNA